MTLAFLALLGAPYIYDISSLRVKNLSPSLTAFNCLGKFQVQLLQMEGAKGFTIRHSPASEEEVANK